jgi:3-oxoadipate enol-lactonase
MPTVQVNDLTMYYERHGAGAPLVLIGGLGLDLSEWGSIVPWLAERYEVIVFDNRGAGRTDKPDMPYSIGMMAEDTAGLMRALGVQRAHIVGVSMGGRIALELALTHPELVNKLVLVSTSARSPRRSWWFPLLGLISALPLFRSKYPQPRYAYHRQRQASGSYDSTGRLHELHVPTLILHGKKDRTTPYPLAEETRAGIAGAQVIAFGGGHLFLFLRERQAFLEAVARGLSTTF